MAQEKTAAEQVAKNANTFFGKWPSRFGNPLKHIEVPLEVQKGDLVSIPNKSSDPGAKPYGPYRVLYVTEPGEGAIVKDAFCLADGGSVTRAKPLTKAELEQALASMQAKMAAAGLA